MLRQTLTKPLNLVLIGTGVGSAYFIRQNDYSVSDIGLLRFLRAGGTAFQIMTDYKFVLSAADTDSNYLRNLSECHSRGAQRILNLCKANGGVFIKVGQHIASLQYLLPDEYTSVLATLHSKAPESNFEEVQQVFRKSIGKELNDCFIEFDDKPCGAASLAQVYKARLKDGGKTVAVKIQHPKVKARSLVDIATMEFFVRIAHAIFPDLHLMWLVEETKRNLPNELNFLQEAKNAETVRVLFKHLKFLHVPEIYFDLSSEKVLTMEFCEGTQINDLKHFREHGIDTHKICKMIGKLYSEMIFKFGFIHSDPHPGNVLVREENKQIKLVLLDHGLYSKLSDEFRMDYCKLWMALMNADKDELVRLCTKMNVGELFGLFACIVTARSWNSVTHGITKVKPTAAERKEIRDFAVSLIPQISLVLERMPRSMLLILKTNDLLRAIEHQLKARYRSDAFLEMAKCCNQAVYEYEIRHATSSLKRFQTSVMLYWIVLKIYLYQAFLTCKEWFSCSKEADVRRGQRLLNRLAG